MLKRILVSLALLASMLVPVTAFAGMTPCS